jgi:putative glutamine amidotransferase
MEISDVTPILIPAFGGVTNFESILNAIDGLLLTGGRANIEPHNYGGPAFPDDEIVDSKRDETVLPLVRGCVERGIPVFGICRGIQEMNVAMGGTLHYRVHVLPGKNDHRMRRDTEIQAERFALRHQISLTTNGYLHRLLGKTETMVNSLHAQSVDRVADGFVIEALSPDGVIEAIQMPKAERFTLGVQWHAEWKAQEHDLARKLFGAFGGAAHEYARAK